MRRLNSALILIPTVALAIGLTSCLGKSSANPGNVGVRTVSLSPAGNLSIDVGATEFFTASATDDQGRTVVGQTTFLISTPPGSTGPAPLSITSGGSACAGTWDQTLSMCHPGTSGVALVTAVVDGVSSTTTTVYIHNHIDSLAVTSAQGAPPTYDCFSQGQTWIYQASAFSNNQDITNSIGPVNWSTTNTGVVTATPFSPPGQPNVLNQVQITAGSPGVTQIFASVAGSNSEPFPVATCLIQYIRLRATGTTTNSISVNNGSSVSLQATAVDTLGNILSRPPLTWSTTNPEVVSFTTSSNNTGTNTASAKSNLGGATVTASCTPPSCNIGVLPGTPVAAAMPTYVYASNGQLSPLDPQDGFGAISIDVTTTAKLPTFTAWAATDQCNNNAGCVSVMFNITPTDTNPITNAVAVPRTPNSMLFDFGSRIYLGSEEGLMFFDVGGTAKTVSLVSSSSTPCNVSLCGRVLAISNDGKLVVVGDDVSPTPQAYIYNSSNSGSVTALVLSDVPKVAAFSPDQSKIFLVTNNGTMYVYSTVEALGIVPVSASPSAAAFSSDGSFAYVAAAPSSVTAFSMCSPQANEPSVNLGSVVTTGLPVQLSLSPVTQVVNVSGEPLTQENILALEPPNIQVLTAQYQQIPLPITGPLPSHSQYFCNAPDLGSDLGSFTAGPTYNLGQGTFVPVYSRLVGDGAAMVVVARHIPAVLLFSVSNGTTTAFPLATDADPLSASSSSDGSTVYVAACDQYQSDGKTCAAGSVHVVDTTARGDYLQVPYLNNSTNNMCNGLGGNAPLCTPDLVVIKPQ